MVDVVREFKAFWHAHPVLTTVNVSLAIFWPLNDMLVPILSGSIISAVDTGQPFMYKIIFLIVTLIGFNLVHIAVSWHDALLIPRLQNFIRHRIIQQLLIRHRENLIDMPTGMIIARTARVPGIASRVIDRFKNTYVPYTLSFIITSLYLCTLNLGIGIAAISGVIAVMMVMWHAPLKCSPPGRLQEEALSAVHEQSEDTLRNVVSVYAANTVNNELSRIATFEEIYNQAYMNTTRCITTRRFIVVTILAMVLAYVGYQCFNGFKAGSLATGTFVTIFLIVINTCGSLAWMTASMNDIVMEWNMISSLKWPDSMTDTVTDSNTWKGQSDDNNMNNFVREGVYFEDVSYRVSTRTLPVLDHVTLSIPPGQAIAIMGHIGSGKSTLMKLLLRFAHPTFGRILLDGVDVRDMQLQDLRRRVGYVPQHPAIFDRPVIDNILYGSTNRRRDEAMALLDELGLIDAFSDLRDSVDTMAGKNGSNLSGGQRQVVQCIRTLLWNTDVIVLDEVTASMDSLTKSRLFAIIKKMIMEGKTVIAVTHDADMLSVVHRVVTLEKGRMSDDIMLKM